MKFSILQNFFCKKLSYDQSEQDLELSAISKYFSVNAKPFPEEHLGCHSTEKISEDGYREDNTRVFATIGYAIMRTRPGGRRRHRDAPLSETSYSRKEGKGETPSPSNVREANAIVTGSCTSSAYSVKYTLLSMPSARCITHLRGKWNYKRIPPTARGSPLAADTFCARLTRTHVKPTIAEALYLRDPPRVCLRLRAKLLRVLAN